MPDDDGDAETQDVASLLDQLLAAMHSLHDPEQLKQYTKHIPELIDALRQARQERGAQRQLAREQQARALSAQAAALLLHNALREAWEHIRRGTLPDRVQRRRWEQALAGSAAQALLIQHNRAQAVATVASIVLHELDSGEVQNATHSLLAATLAAYEAGRQQ
jgi:hypothetical protein